VAPEPADILVIDVANIVDAKPTYFAPRHKPAAPAGSAGTTRPASPGSAPATRTARPWRARPKARAAITAVATAV
jgi:hypothetical protein